VERLPKEREVTWNYKWKPLASRPIGRPKNRWEDDVRKNWHTVQVKNWKESVLSKDLWKANVDQTKTHVELYRVSRRYKSRPSTSSAHDPQLKFTARVQLLLLL
jgi:hypothetical protein